MHKHTSLFSKKHTSLFSEKHTSLIAEKHTYLFSGNKGVSLPEQTPKTEEK
jgi:hypothetical protein